MKGPPWACYPAMHVYMHERAQTRLSTGRQVIAPQSPSGGSTASWQLNLRIKPRKRLKRDIRSLDRIIEWRGKPGTIRVDNGPEYISEKLMKWAKKHGVTIQHIQPGQPQQNAYVRRPADDTPHRREGSATTAPSSMNGLTNTSSKVSRRHRITPRNGSGHTTTTAPTSLSRFAGKPLPGNGASVASHPP